MSDALEMGPDERAKMPFGAHLVELRNRLLRSVIAIAVCFFFAWTFHVELFDLVSAPVRSAMADNGLFAVRAIRITEAISVYIKIALLGGVMLASPYVFLQVWAFVAPGLLTTERRFALPVVSASVLFFVVGTSFCYLVVLPFMTDFLIAMTLQGQDISLVPTLQDVVSYSLWLLLAFGLVFELPVFMYFLSVMQLVTWRGLVAFYRYWVVISFILGAILTPTPDPVNQALMSGPLVVLYGIGVGIAWVVEHDRAAGSRVSWKGASVLALLLSASVLLGGARVAHMAARHPIDDLPTSALQVVGVRLANVERLVQQAGAFGKRALGPLVFAKRLLPDADGNQTAWMTRDKDGAAAIVQGPGASDVIRRLARSQMVTEVDYAGGRSVVITIPGAKEHWRIAAPDAETLWVGVNASVGRLKAARNGSTPGVGADARMAELAQKLRAAGPLFAISANEDGIGGWLPAGALRDTVTLATAVFPPQADRLILRFSCRGPEASDGLRLRLQSWTADARDRDIGGSGDAQIDRLTDEIAALAGIINRASALAARSSGVAGDEALASAWRGVGSEAENIQTRLHGIGGDGAAGPKPTTVLSKLVAAPAVVTASTEGPDLLWKIENKPVAVLDAFFAPSAAGLDTAQLPVPAAKTKKAKGGADKGDKGAPNRAVEGSQAPVNSGQKPSGDGANRGAAGAGALSPAPPVRGR